MVKMYLFIALLFVGCGSSVDVQKYDWTPLFNDNDLEGWLVKMEGQKLGEDSAEVFKMEGGVLKIHQNTTEGSTDLGHAFYKQPYSHFRLRFEYRFTGNRFAIEESWPEQFGGVVYHGQAPESMGYKQAYPISLEFQLLGGKQSGERSTGNVCTIGTQVFTDNRLNKSHCINSNSITYEGNQWVAAEIEVFGDSLARHYINGELVLEYTRLQIGGGFVSEEFNWEAGNVPDSEEWIKRDGDPLKSGYIAVQAHDPIELRKMEISDLSGQAVKIK